MKQRLVWVDSLKGILMILVVLGHAIQYTMGDTACENNHVWNYIYSFHMPAFIAISGYVSYPPPEWSTKNRLSIIHKRATQLLIPYFLWEILYYLSRGIVSFKSLINCILHPYFWFLWVLFFIITVFQFGDWLSEKIKIKQELILIGLSLLLIITMVLANIRICGYQFIAYYFPFYVFGHYLHKYPELCTSSRWLLLILGCIWGAMGWFWKMHELPSFLVSVPLPNTLMQYVYRFTTGLIAVYSIICVTPKLLNTVSLWNKPLMGMGRISLGIYVVHLLLIPYIVRIVNHITGIPALATVISFLIACAVSWSSVCILARWKPTAKLLLGKYSYQKKATRL